jgi:hypothetical protein
MLLLRHLRRQRKLILTPHLTRLLSPKPIFNPTITLTLPPHGLRDLNALNRNIDFLQGPNPLKALSLLCRTSHLTHSACIHARLQTNCGLGLDMRGVEMRVVVRGGVLDHELVVASFDGVARYFCNEGGHGHFDVEFYHVGDRVELDIHDLVFEGHEADEHELCGR